MLKQSGKNGQLGTFAGVFTPSVLTILGIILFLRTGYVVGRTGLAASLLIMALSGAIAILTATSLSAIATNMRVRGGGDYYLISRTLGVEYGGAIGVVLFFAQTLSIAFYCFGFGEALSALLPASDYLTPRTLAAALMLALFVFAWLGADWASKLQLLIMAVLAAALVSFFVGGLRAFDAATLESNWAAPADALPFWAAFALFFPAVTGFTQGVSMSGDLRDPARSLPLGTFAAVGVSIIVYVASAVVFAAALPVEVLGEDYQAMKAIAWIGVLISAGVMAATASSAMASFLGGPRILQALSADRVFPFLAPFATGARRDNNPRRAVLLAFAIGMAVIAVGDLNAIAPVVAMFFLVSYGLLNYATWFEARASSPQFRPQFRFYHEYLSLAGALGCLVAMLAIHPAAAAVAVTLLFGVHQYVKRTTGKAQWADSRHAYRFQRVRELLVEMRNDELHPRDWRPQILVFSKDHERRTQLLAFGAWIEGDSGITSVVSIVTDDDVEPDAVRAELAEDIERLEVDAFPLAIRADSFSAGMEILLQAYGIGPIKANIVLLNWLEEAPEPERENDERVYGRNMQEALRLGSNIVALCASDAAYERIEATAPEDRRINVWWDGTATSRLSLLLAHLMRRTGTWRDAEIVVHAEGGSSGRNRTAERLQDILDDMRVRARINIVEKALDDDALLDVASEGSVTFIPMVLHGDRPTDFVDQPISRVEQDRCVVALVIARSEIDLDGDPDNGDESDAD